MNAQERYDYWTCIVDKWGKIIDSNIENQPGSSGGRFFDPVVIANPIRNVSETVNDMSFAIDDLALIVAMEFDFDMTYEKSLESLMPWAELQKNFIALKNHRNMIFQCLNKIFKLSPISDGAFFTSSCLIFDDYEKFCSWMMHPRLEKMKAFVKQYLIIGR